MRSLPDYYAIVDENKYTGEYLCPECYLKAPVDCGYEPGYNADAEDNPIICCNCGEHINVEPY